MSKKDSATWRSKTGFFKLFFATKYRTKNHTIFKYLKSKGIPLPNIRLSLHKLTGITQPSIAEAIGTSRVSVTNHMSGRNNTKAIQDKIAEIFDIPADVLFEDNRRHAK